MTRDQHNAPTGATDGAALQVPEQCTMMCTAEAIRPMRLLQVCTAFRPGGIQRHVLDLAAALEKRGHHLAFAGTPGEWLDERSAATFLPIDLEGVAQQGRAEERISLPARLVNALRAALRLRAFVRAERIELIHAHESAPALVAWLATIGLPTAIVVTYHGSALERVAGFARIARLAATRVITPSWRCAEDLREIGGIAASKIQVIGLGIEPRPHVDATTRERVRAAHLGPEGRRLVVTIARLAQQKGIDVLIEVVRRIAAQRADVRFVVVGDGPLREDVERGIAGAGVERYLALAGYETHPEEHLAAADLFALTSRWEGLPVTIVEAFREGLPVVATDAGGVRELVDETVGRVAAIGDVDALSAAIDTILADDALRSRLAANARMRGAEQRFSPRYAHAALERAYAEALAGRSTQVPA
jgi:glycosyltransferase involved in cell wall biosynthesis